MVCRVPIERSYARGKACGLPALGYRDLITRERRSPPPRIIDIRLDPISAYVAPCDQAVYQTLRETGT
jgi:hypothetical protein